LIDAKEEIISTILSKTREHPLLSKIDEGDILEVIDHLFESQFKPDENKTKKFVDQKITEIASDLVRKETVGA
tara:strand:+ start:190 stop:408 length:219 start_codon:yes stop_codon:yes gene_type:complete